MENWTFGDFLFFALAVWLGWQIFKVFLAVEELRKKKFDSEVEAIVKDRVIPTIMEHYKGQLFLYNRQTGKFIAQALSEDELKEKLKQWFPNKAFIVVEHQYPND